METANQTGLQIHPNELIEMRKVNLNIVGKTLLMVSRSESDPVLG